jgi:hypothetical protein
MGKARKEIKPKGNRKNWIKNNNRIQENERILKDIFKSFKNEKEKSN